MSDRAVKKKKRTETIRSEVSGGPNDQILKNNMSFFMETFRRFKLMLINVHVLHLHVSLLQAFKNLQPW